MSRTCLIIIAAIAVVPAWSHAGAPYPVWDAAAYDSPSAADQRQPLNQPDGAMRSLPPVSDGTSQAGATPVSSAQQAQSGRVILPSINSAFHGGSQSNAMPASYDQSLNGGPVYVHDDYDKFCASSCEQHVCGNICGPDICRFDCPPECVTCETDEYCIHPCIGHEGQCRHCDKCGGWVCDGCFCDVKDRAGYVADPTLRFGWWEVDTNGALTKIGEWQDLNSSPFWDVDGISSDGIRTFNFFATGNDLESNQGALQFYGPNGKANVEFQRYLRRRDRDPLDNFTGTPVVVEDLNVGEDYAIRVQELDASATTYLTQNVKLRVDVWGMRKFGERQALGMAHCFNVGPSIGNNVCHVLSQRQQIDWLTMEITPRVEGRFGPVTVEYSRPMRGFSSNDQLVTREYTNPFGNTSLFPPPGSGVYTIPPFPHPGPQTAGYAFVPDNYTEIDQVKVGVDVTDDTKFYGFGYYGHTVNKFRDTERHFGGYDLRLTNYSVDGLTLTGYAKMYDQDGQRPTFLLPEETSNFTAAEAQSRIRSPVEYRRTTAGVKSRWRPLRGDPRFGNLQITSGYEYELMDRENAIYRGVVDPVPAIFFAQPDTITHTIHTGVQSRLTSTLDSFVRYKVLFSANPLYGFRETNGALNSNQPEQQHIVEIGGTWTPTNNFMASAQVAMDARRHFADFSIVPGNVVDFDEESYPIIGTIWYAPTQRLSMTGGVAFLYNWIDQNIILGDDYVEDPMMPNPLLNPETRRWNYTGQTSVISFSSSYACSQNVTLVGGYEYVRGFNGFSAGPIADLWPDLPTYSRVIIETQRLNAGIDWKPYDLMTVYLRYIMFDYDDRTQMFNSGDAHMGLVGCTLIR